MGFVDLTCKESIILFWCLSDLKKGPESDAINGLHSFFSFFVAFLLFISKF